MKEVKKKTNSNKKKKVLGLSALAALLLLVLGTFAWDVYKSEVENKFGNALTGGDINIIEDFPDGHLTPGGELKKEVDIQNNSSAPVFVRAKFVERLGLLAHDAAEPDPKKRLELVAVDTADIDYANGMPKTGAPKDEYIPEVIDGRPIEVAAKTNVTDPGIADPSYGEYLKKWHPITVTGVNDVNTGIKVFAKVERTKTTNAAGETTWSVDTNYVAYAEVKVSDSNMGEVSKKVVAKLTDEDHLAGKVDFKLETDFDDQTGEVKGYSLPVGEKATHSFYKKLVYTDKDWATAVIPTDHTKSALHDLLTFKAPGVTAAASDNKWTYNAKDGYFYYIGVLTSGQTTDARLLDAVKLDSSANVEFSYLDYSLKIEAEGVVTKKAALESEFGLTSGDIYDKLKVLATE